jgi:hypothetical protein
VGLTMFSHVTASRALPNGLIIGPMRAGTTWIYQYLASIESVGLPKGVKETFFFDRRYHKGLDWYAHHFDSSPKISCSVEVASTYFHCPEATSRIACDLGVIPLVSTLRNPIDRTFSLYLHMLRYGMIQGSFRDAITTHEELLHSSRYTTHLTRWFNTFGRDKVLVLFMDDLVREPEQYATRLCHHLGIPFQPIDETLQGRVNESALPYSPFLASFVNSAADKLRSYRLYRVIEFAKWIGLKKYAFGQQGKKEIPILQANDRAWLYDQLLPEIEKLEAILDIDLSKWKEPATLP